MKKIFAINTGSTSTKVALFHDNERVLQDNLFMPEEELKAIISEKAKEINPVWYTVVTVDRNMSGGNVPKSATMSEYRTATGMEVLYGYLHVTGKQERLRELFALAYASTEE